MIRALASGVIGSSSPAGIKAGLRSRGSSGRLVQPARDISWWKEPGRARACHRVQQVAGGPGILTGVAAEQFTGDAGRITGVQVAPRREHAQQDAGVAGHHQRAWCGSYQHQAAHPGRAAQGELLRELASPGDAQHIGLLIAELVEYAA
jgi:hypothetical protein